MGVIIQELNCGLVIHDLGSPPTLDVALHRLKIALNAAHAPGNCVDQIEAFAVGVDPIASEPSNPPQRQVEQRRKGQLAAFTLSDNLFNQSGASRAPRGSSESSSAVTRLLARAR